MTETRELLRAVIGETTPAIPDVEAVTRRAAAHRRRERLIAGAVALALTAGIVVGLGFAVNRGGGTPGQGPAIVGPTREVFIPSVSMKPTLKVGDTVLVDEGAYRDSNGLPARADIIAFDVSSYDGTFVKRVVGLPGDLVEERAGRLYVNGREFPMPSPELNPRNMGPWTVDPRHVFVVGDNLSDSNDSRFPEMGQIPITRIIGKVVEILSPNDRRATVAPPAANSTPGPDNGT